MSVHSCTKFTVVYRSIVILFRQKVYGATGTRDQIWMQTLFQLSYLVLSNIVVLNICRSVTYYPMRPGCVIVHLLNLVLNLVLMYSSSAVDLSRPY